MKWPWLQLKYILLDLESGMLTTTPQQNLCRLDSIETLYSGHFILSAQLMKPNYTKNIQMLLGVYYCIINTSLLL